MKKEKTSGLVNLLKIPELKKVKTVGQEARGLTFTSRKRARALLFEFNKPVNLKIHSMFVWFPFVAIWINHKNEIIEKRIIKPWKASVKSKKPFKKLIEIPINEFYRGEIQEILTLN